VDSRPRFAVGRFASRSEQPDDQSLTTRIQKEVANGIAHRITGIQPAEQTLEISETVYGCGIIYRSAHRSADECGNRCRDAGYRAYAAGNLLDVNTRIGQCTRHTRSPLVKIRSDE